MISSNELCKPEQKVKVFLHFYKVQVYKGIEQGYQVSIRAIIKTCAYQSNFLHPLLSTMPRAKQAKAAEPKKRLASTKWISEEEISPKKAKHSLSRCEVCNLELNSTDTLASHEKGMRHMVRRLQSLCSTM